MKRNFLEKMQVIKELLHGGSIWTDSRSFEYGRMNPDFYLEKDTKRIGWVHHKTIDSLIKDGIIYPQGQPNKYELIHTFPVS